MVWQPLLTAVQSKLPCCADDSSDRLVRGSCCCCTPPQHHRFQAFHLCQQAQEVVQCPAPAARRAQLVTTAACRSTTCAAGGNAAPALRRDRCAARCALCVLRRRARRRRRRQPARRGSVWHKFAPPLSRGRPEPPLRFFWRDCNAHNRKRQRYSPVADSAAHHSARRLLFCIFSRLSGRLRSGTGTESLCDGLLRPPRIPQYCP